jgi:hypothetical protein
MGGSILGGSATTDNDFRSFPVQGGQVVFEYSAQGLGLGKDATSNAIVSLLPADGNGNRVGSRPLSALTIPLGGVSSATVTPEFTSSIADGTDRPIRVVISNLRDAFGNVVPDGTRVGLLAKNWYRLSDGGCCNGSVGGAFIDGDTTADAETRGYTVTGGRVVATYSPRGVALSVGDVRNAIFSALILKPDSSFVATRPFATGLVTLSSASGATATIEVEPTTLLADAQQHLSDVVISDLRDSQGRTVPDGTRVAVTAANWYRASDGGCCNNSIGGGFLGGAATNDGNFKAFTVNNGRLQFTYADTGIALRTGETGPAIVSVLPADGAGNRIGSTPILSTTIMLAGIGSATFSAPATVTPGGTATVVFSDIRDQFGTRVPDGTRVGLTAANWYRTSDGGCCNNSAGGSISDGQAAQDGSFKMFSVTNGQIVATFAAPANNNVTSVISAVPMRTDGSRIGERPFAAGSIRVTNTP